MSVRIEYLARFKPLQRGRVFATLRRQQGLDGVYFSRWRIAEMLAARGASFDRERGRLNHGTHGHFYDVSALTVAVAEYAEWLVANAA